MKHLLLTFILLSFANTKAQEQLIVYFDFDVDEANTASSGSLSQWIESHKGAEITKIYGYADRVGDALYNQDLSERRAAYVYSQLKNAGLKLDHVEEKGFGESESHAVDGARDRKVMVYWMQPTPPAAAAPKPAAPQPTAFTQNVVSAKKGDKIKIPNLHFFDNSDGILPTSRPILQELLKIMQDNPQLRIDIQGHICCQRKEMNEISLKRAVAVYNFLVRNGISKDRLSYKSFGSSRPVYKLPEKSEEEKVANRRVEIEILEN